MATCERSGRRRTAETFNTVAFDEGRQGKDVDADLIPSPEHCRDASGATAASDDSSSAGTSVPPMLAHVDGSSEPETLVDAQLRTHEGIEKLLSSPYECARDADGLVASVVAGTIAVDSIGMIDRISDEARGVVMLSPIAATKEVQINLDMGESMGWKVSDNHRYIETGTAPFLAAPNTFVFGTKSEDKNGDVSSESRSVKGDESNEEYQYFNGRNQDETGLHDSHREPNVSVHHALLSPVAETCCVVHESSSTADSHLNVSRNSRTEYDGLVDLQNDSMVTYSKRDEIARTQEELGVTRVAFLHRLRGAAFRRKKRLVNSRNDMLAMERNHRDDIEAARLQLHRLSVDPPALQQTSTQRLLSNEYKSKAKSAPKTKRLDTFGAPEAAKRPVRTALSPLLGVRRPATTADTLAGTGFAARPLPKTTGEKGHGGLSGISKVEKRPLTQPVSPLLGSRRQLNDVSAARPFEPAKTGFKALPIPKSLRANGVSGVPRVPSKPTTVPWSPLLGFRRQPVQKPVAHTLHPNKTLHSASTPSSLIGLNLLYTSSNENQPPQNHTLIHPVSVPGYEPHSTVRAQKRAEYDLYLVEREKERLAEESQARREHAKILKAELKELRKHL